MECHVTITEEGRSGTVRYMEGTEQLSFYWEFGGGDAVAIIQVSDMAAWRTGPAWMAGRRAEVLRYVADEVIKQRAPGSFAQIDEAAGTIILRQGKAPEQDRLEAAAWMGRYRRLRMKLGLVVLIGGLVAAVFFWVKNTVLVIDPGKGTPMGESVRTDAHIATLISSLEPYTPSLHRDASKDRYSLSLFLVPLDGGEPRSIPFAEGLEANGYSLAKVLGSDGRTLWMDVNGLRGVDLRTYELLPDDAVRRVDQRTVPKAWGGSPLPPRTEEFLAAGLFTGPNTWLGLHSPMEAGRDFKPKSWLKHVVHAEHAKEQRRFHRGALDPDTSGGHHSVLAMTPLGEATYLNAAFVRLNYTSEPIRLTDPPGALMVYTSEPGLKGTLVVARADTAGTVLWKTDTGIDRFTLQQILPGEGSVAFVGTRPPVPDKVSEPILVLVDSGSGALRVISLWQ